MPSVISWSSIELLHNVVKTLTHLASLPPELGPSPLPKVTYKAKVKLHGTNCGVQVHADGLVMQSRETVLTPEADYKGFAKWVASQDAYFRSLPKGITVFGEWCGPGVEGGMAVSSLGEKQFCVFGVQVGTGESARVVYEPTYILSLLSKTVPFPKNLHVLPWQNFCVVIDFADPASLEAAAGILNDTVRAVEAEDPWVKATFSVSGLGEGIVLYPVAVEGREVPVEPEALAHLMFKAKGAKHRTAGTKEAVQVAPEVVSSVAGFVDLMVTEARLAQGLSVACGGERNPRLTREFLAWVGADVQKESADELEASGLAWAQVQAAVQARAREWFLKK